MVRVVRASQAEIEAAVDALRDGELVAFPTETVYGLGANASNPAAVRKVFELKGRPPAHPVIVHIDERRYLKRWVREVSPAAEKLAEAFWPGPLTLVLPRAEGVHDVRDRRPGQRRDPHPLAPDGPAAARRVRRRHRGAVGQPFRPPQRDARRACAATNSAMR